ncbi:hypothetical protein Pfo_015254 [Paulownia fortunei]|nr:hypothetical protein Pfo_015254 [Paulownia fortunei]
MAEDRNAFLSSLPKRRDSLLATSRCSLFPTSTLIRSFVRCCWVVNARSGVAKSLVGKVIREIFRFCTYLNDH